MSIRMWHITVRRFRRGAWRKIAGIEIGFPSDMAADNPEIANGARRYMAKFHPRMKIEDARYDVGPSRFFKD